MSAKDPPVQMILELDAEYREKAKGDELKKIAAKRLNPGHRTLL